MIRGLHIYLTLYFMNIITHQPPRLPLFPYTTLFRSPPALALFGMKLRREDHAALDGGGKAHPVVAPRRGDAVDRHRRVIGVDEVEVGAVRNPLEQAQPPAVLDLIPAHVRDLASGREPAHDTGQ